MREEILGKVRKMEDLVEYQQDSIVSKIVLKQKEGNVTLFAFWKGQELSEHTAPFNAIVVGFDGSGIVTIDGNENIVAKGDIIIMPANHPHAVKATENFKMMLIMLKEIK